MRPSHARASTRGPRWSQREDRRRNPKPLCRDHSLFTRTSTSSGQWDRAPVWARAFHRFDVIKPSPIMSPSATVSPAEPHTPDIPLGLASGVAGPALERRYGLIFLELNSALLWNVRLPSCADISFELDDFFGAGSDRLPDLILLPEDCFLRPADFRRAQRFRGAQRNATHCAAARPSGRWLGFMISTITARGQRQAEARRIVSRLMTELWSHCRERDAYPPAIQRRVRSASMTGARRAIITVAGLDLANR